MKKVIRLTESDIHNIVKEAVRRAINEDSNAFYSEEDTYGKTGKPGMVKSYNIGYMTREDAENEARENGYENVEEYLKAWWNEISGECPWEWTETGEGYGYNGTTIFRDGGVVCKDIFGQIMVDEYPQKDAEYNEDFYNRLNGGEYWTTNESILREGLNNQPDYTHYAVNKATNKIVYSWAYGGIEGSELRQFKKDYFIIDLTDNDLDPKQYKILGKAALMRQGIDPDDDSNWANS